MGSNDIFKKPYLLFVCLLLIAYSLLSLTACGRRGDPVWVEPRDEKAVESEKVDKDKGGKKAEEKPESLREREKQEIQIVTPDPPTGLAGVYTQQSVVLVWNETAGRDIKYRVYRSSGDNYILTGETVTPAFTDRTAEPDKKYYYRITAVGTAEGPPSKELLIVTEVH